MHLLQLAADYEQIRQAGGAALGVGPASADQARHLKESRGVPFPLLLDPDHTISAAIGLGRQPLLRLMFHPKGWWRWAKALVPGRQGKITGAYRELPAVIIVDG